MRVVTVIGARPQFIKAAVVSRALREKCVQEVLVHTGQHFHHNMSDIFFDDLDLPAPDYNLNIHSLGHAAMTGRMMESLETIMIEEKPDWLLVYGDTNSTLAAALVAAKLHIPIAHIEAGLRSYNRNMPEEINRLVTDQLATLLLVPTLEAIDCLRKESISKGVHLVGDVMLDAVLQYQARAQRKSKILKSHDLKSEQFYLATLHRPANTDERQRLKKILIAFSELDAPVVFPVHPRTEKSIHNFDLEQYLSASNIHPLPPASYLDMLVLEKHCRAVITDSGGIQKEAYISRRPCFTLREETEWVETVAAGWNFLVSPESLIETISKFKLPSVWPKLYGDGCAAEKIARTILSTNIA